MTLTNSRMVTLRELLKPQFQNNNSDVILVELKKSLNFQYALTGTLNGAFLAMTSSNVLRAVLDLAADAYEKGKSVFWTINCLFHLLRDESFLSRSRLQAMQVLLYENSVWDLESI